VEGLRDIKGIVEVHEYSLQILVGAIMIGLLVLGLLFYLFKNRRKRGVKLSKKEMALERLKDIDFSDTKNVVYTFSVEGALFKDENNASAFEDIEKALTPYKYKQEVPEIEEALKEKIKAFVRSLR